MRRAAVPNRRDALRVRRAALRMARASRPIRRAAVPIREAAFPMGNDALWIRKDALHERRASLLVGEDALPGVDHAAPSGFDHAPAEPEACRRADVPSHSLGGALRRGPLDDSNRSRHGGSGGAGLVAPLLPMGKIGRFRPKMFDHARSCLSSSDANHKPRALPLRRLVTLFLLTALAFAGSGSASVRVVVDGRVRGRRSGSGSTVGVEVADPPSPPRATGRAPPTPDRR
jgi:hypothetical protein